MKYLFLIPAAALTLASCHTLYGNYDESKVGVPDSLYRDTTAAYQVVADADTAQLGCTPWRQMFTDPQLQILIEKALQQNSDLRQADITIEQAQAALQTKRLAYYPQIAFSPQGTVSSFDFGRASKTYSVPIQASWQIDAFGTLRNAKRQAQVSLEQTRAARQATRTAIISAVANMYYTLQMLDEQVQTTDATLEIWKKNILTMEAMQEAGMTNGAAVAQAKANRLGIESNAVSLQENIRQTENALCGLLHETPHPIERGRFQADSFPQEFSVGVPLQLLSARPDVRAAELQMAYAFYGVQGARGAFYPQISLSGQAGWTNSAGIIVNPGKILASAVASLTQPLFAQGQLRANLKISKLQQESAQIKFEDALLSAGQEVSNALSQYHSAEQRAQIGAKQVEQLQQALEKTELLFTYGNSTTYLEKLTAEQSLLQARLTLISDKFDKVQAAISLYQALGGGRD